MGSSKNTTYHSLTHTLQLHGIALLSLIAIVFLITVLHNPPLLLLPTTPPLVISTAISNVTSHLVDVSLLKAQDGLSGCDLFDGRWVADGSGARYLPGSCPFVDVAFNCFGNGRLDVDYARLRWQPHGCKLPRFNGKKMLQMLRGKRLAFVGDSLNRNMWQSLVCMLRESLQNKKGVSEIAGRNEFRSEGFYSVRFTHYNCTIEFFRSPFLVQESQTSHEGSQRDTLRLDVVHRSSDKYKDAEILVFNTAHWWTHEKTSLGKDFYQEGDHVHPKLTAAEAYRKALSTWAKWVDANVDGNRTHVFFRGYSSSHFSGGQWNSGGNCHGEMQPITNNGMVGRYPKMMTILEGVLEEMSTPVQYLNITRMTEYRKDGHPSVYRQPAEVRTANAFQDCSHWCLPGVPDAWNELLYAMLLRNANSRRRLK